MKLIKANLNVHLHPEESLIVIEYEEKDIKIEYRVKTDEEDTGDKDETISLSKMGKMNNRGKRSKLDKDDTYSSFDEGVWTHGKEYPTYKEGPGPLLTPEVKEAIKAIKKLSKKLIVLLY